MRSGPLLGLIVLSSIPATAQNATLPSATPSSGAPQTQEQLVAAIPALIRQRTDAENAYALCDGANTKLRDQLADAQRQIADLQQRLDGMKNKGVPK